AISRHARSAQTTSHHETSSPIRHRRSRRLPLRSLKPAFATPSALLPRSGSDLAPRAQRADSITPRAVVADPPPAIAPPTAPLVEAGLRDAVGTLAEVRL